MLAEQKIMVSGKWSVVSGKSLRFVKMSGAGNDFVIFDARKSAVELSSQAVQKISDRKNIGCDQLIVIRNSSLVDCFMEIYNPDGSKSGMCGNATRCVASIIFSDSKKDRIKIETSAKTLECWRDGNLICVNMGKVKFLPKVSLHNFSFSCLDIGNLHAVSFLSEKISDEKFFDVGPKVSRSEIFAGGTNVEFAQIVNDELIEVRVFERGAGETLACGSGACAVAVLAMKENLIKSNSTTIRFKGGDLKISWNGEDVVMSGGYKKIFDGVVDEEFLA